MDLQTASVTPSWFSLTIILPFYWLFLKAIKKLITAILLNWTDIKSNKTCSPDTQIKKTD